MPPWVFPSSACLAEVKDSFLRCKYPQHRISFLPAYKVMTAATYLICTTVVPGSIHIHKKKKKEEKYCTAYPMLGKDSFPYGNNVVIHSEMPVF